MSSLSASSRESSFYEWEKNRCSKQRPMRSSADMWYPRHKRCFLFHSGELFVCRLQESCHCLVEESTSWKYICVCLRSISSYEPTSDMSSWARSLSVRSVQQRTEWRSKNSRSTLTRWTVRCSLLQLKRRIGVDIAPARRRRIHIYIYILWGGCVNFI